MRTRTNKELEKKLSVLKKNNKILLDNNIYLYNHNIFLIGKLSFILNQLTIISLNKEWGIKKISKINRLVDDAIKGCRQ